MIFYFITHVRIPAILLLGVWFLMQLFSGVGSLGAGAGVTGVAYWAHVGGFVAGLAIVALWRLVRRRPFSERPRSWG